MKDEIKNMLANKKIRNLISGFILHPSSFLLLVALCVAACAAYVTPPKSDWAGILHGATFAPMTSPNQIAKKPIFMGADLPVIASDQGAIYMARLESDLYNGLLKPGLQVLRVGPDVMVVLTRSAFMYSDAPEISPDGVDTLKTITRILKKYNGTYIEITGYTDYMQNRSAAVSLSDDMASRVAVFMANSGIKPVRMFVVGAGSARPIAAQDDVGRQMNRRVELRISLVK
ncbi:MAG: OmpA family protein [Rickettsiales bacterium]|jgi:outer membrane protein OmpA-like peptidoglycan-associated protein|nr:OmpA family protein [Rickettsiales bacterium]